MTMDPTVSFNATTPHGRAILHVLEKSALARTLVDHGGHGIELRRGDRGDCTLVVHPSFAAWCSDGESQLLLFIESLNGQSPVVLRYALDVDQPSQRAMAEAMFIAAGIEATTIVGVPA